MKKYILLLIMLIVSDSNSYLYSQYAIREAFPNLTFAYPTEMVIPPDTTDRIFVLEKRGKIILFNNSQSVSATKTFLDITDRVTADFYAGLFGIAFHPAYSSNGYFYVYYMSGSGAGLTLKLSRFTRSGSNPDSALSNSELNLISLPAPSSNHNGSVIRFGADGYLYFAFGDSSPGSGGDPNNKAQNLSEMFGKMHRINVDSASGGRNYSIPPANPFYQNSSGYKEEIYSYGFRNIWKFSFDNTTGKLWLADVGQTRWEEINIVESGKNYGWRRKEGLVCYNPSSNCDTAGFTPTDPLFVYGHTSGNASICGGYVYRGSQMPGLFGKYIYGDYTSGRIWALTWDGINPPSNQQLFDTPYGVVSFGEDKLKNIYFIHFNATAGKIYKIIDSTISSSAQINNIFPSKFYLYNNYPNPFNPSTLIKYSVPGLSKVNLTVYDVTGKAVITLINTFQPAGEYSIVWNGKDAFGNNFPSGAYFYNLNAGDNFSETKRMVLVK